MMKNVIFIAPPAAGKGTQSSILENLGYVHLSTGDMLRKEINSNSALGNEIKDLVNSGSLVSDDIVIELIQNNLKNLDKPFILDGFPRTLNQAVQLDKLFSELNIDNYEVIYLNLDMESALKRTLGRIVCECGKSYNIYYDDLKPQQEGVCDNCGKNLIKRNDDNEESFKVRFKTYESNTLPIVEYYQNKKKLNEIDATKSSDEVASIIRGIL